MARAELTGSVPASASVAPLTVEVAVSVAPREVQRVRLQVPAGSTVRAAATVQAWQPPAAAPGR